MARTLAIAALTAVAIVSGSGGAAQGRVGAQTRVIGGTRIAASAAPWVADLDICSASLIAPDRVLTAAHCAYALDIGDLVKLAGGEVRHIVRMANDYRFPHNLIANVTTSIPYPYDAAILELDAPVTDITAIRLAAPADTALYGPGTTAETYGFGVTNAERQSGSGALRRAVVRIHSDRDCLSLLAAIDPSDEFRALPMLCTTDPDATAPYASGCFGDSGGPLVVTAPDGTPLQVGVDNWGVACGEKHGDPENYTDVAVIQPFATAAAPVWQPRALDRPQLHGTVATGRTVFCTAPIYADPQPTRLLYRFAVDGLAIGRPSTTRRYVIPDALRHDTLTCAVAAETRGGRTFSEDSRAAFVAGRAQLHG